jgi:hypothetical protein
MYIEGQQDKKHRTLQSNAGFGGVIYGRKQERKV